VSKAPSCLVRRLFAAVSKGDFMSEYYDLKQRPFAITQSVLHSENRAETEEEIVNQLYKIFAK